ncbi:hypothetical protein SAMN05421504_105606 [Amycolatopsis xylanica]|uniref:PknH-like extracellular domain-containing protein n=1 Tax=Amycolatopsis xylanica TaxID=589385 RepID=A0A1H3K045_9PSEU|nr:hypothetical protein [Amycolatopsis xylanica]SDY45580.1 hypothetical protein SAMN05421504_105606 [Amycolatopsis xylanica]
MPRRGAAVVAAVALLGLSGCADRPNDLDTYYDDPTTSVKPPSPSATPVPPPPRPSASASVERPVLLTAADLAEEGVERASVGPAKGCLAELPDNVIGEAAWWYPTGASLNQRVVSFPPKGAGAALKAVKCDGQQHTIPAQPGVDAQRVWCTGPTCTVLLAKGATLSAVQVTAGSAARALDAAKRLAPLAAEKLDQV